jgi:hypothetical protein
MKQKNKNNFIMDTDWLFEGILDAEQKQYVLLDYFQKMNQHLERMEVYPMFIELSFYVIIILRSLRRYAYIFIGPIFVKFRIIGLVDVEMNQDGIKIKSNKTLIKYKKQLLKKKQYKKLIL